MRLKSKPKSMTFTGESTDGVKKSTFSGFKSRCKTPGHGETVAISANNLEDSSLWKKGTCFTQNERNPLQVHIILKSLASSPSSLHCKLFFGSFWTLAHSFFIDSLLIENTNNTTNHRSPHFQTLLYTIYPTPHFEKGILCVNLRAPQTNVTVCSFQRGWNSLHQPFGDPASLVTITFWRRQCEISNHGKIMEKLCRIPKNWIWFKVQYCAIFDCTI